MDSDTLAVLQALQLMGGTRDDVMDGWFYASTIAQRLHIAADTVRDEFDVLAQDRYLELNMHPTRERDSTLARMTTNGDAALASYRKLQRTAESQLPSLGTTYEYDAFISHAGEDTAAIALPIKQRLKVAGISAWLDQDELILGDALIDSLDRGMRNSRYAIIILSPHYIRKPYPRAELHALLNRQINGNAKIILPVLWGGITQDDVRAFNLFLADRVNVNADSAGLDETIRQILKVFRPPEVTVMPAALGPVSPAIPTSGGRRDVPSDALDDQPHLAMFQPCIHIETELISQNGAEYTITYAIHNIGQGVARKVRAFLPGLVVESLSRPIEPGMAHRRSLRLDQRLAFIDYLGLIAQVIVEFEDHAGNLYRQYGDVRQDGVAGGWSQYTVLELARPYLVPQRIVEDDPRERRWRLS